MSFDTITLNRNVEKNQKKKKKKKKKYLDKLALYYTWKQKTFMQTLQKMLKQDLILKL